MAETITNVSVGIVTGDRSKIDSATVKNGRIYFSKDTGELFYDWNGTRVQVCPQTTPNNATLSIKANGTDVSTFTANSSINRSIDISAGSNITISGTASTGKIVISGTADTKNTAGATVTDNSIYLVGPTTTGSASAQTYANASVYMRAGKLYSDKKVVATTDQIPTVNNGTLTIKQNDSTLGTFTANQSGNTEVNITVPSVPSTPNGFAIVAIKGQSSSTAVNLEADSSVDTLNMTGGTGIMLVPTASSDTVVVNHTNSVTAVTNASLLKVKYDAQGHITGSTIITKSDITGLGIPGSDTDTKNTAGNSTSTSKLYLTGTTSTSSGTTSYAQTYVNDSAYAENGSLYSGGKRVATEEWVNSSLANYSKGNSEIYKGTCSTGATTAAKVVTCSAFTSAKLVKGAIIFVTFDYTNTAGVGSITMNVNSTGAKPIKKIWMNAVSNLNNNQELQANETYIFQYDGTNWVCMNCDWTYTYSKINTAAIDSLSTGDNWCIDGSLLKYAVDKWAPGAISGSYPDNYSNLQVITQKTGGQTISLGPNSSTDTLTFKAGDNVTLGVEQGETVGADKITINAVDTKYTGGNGINVNNTNNTIDASIKLKVNVSTGGAISSSVYLPVTNGIAEITFEAGDNVSITTTNSGNIKISASGFVIGEGINKIRSISVSEYEALPAKDASTFYVLTADVQ